MDKIPTAEEFVNSECTRLNIMVVDQLTEDDLAEMCINFANIHREAALKAAEKNIGFIQTSSEELNAKEYQPFITANDNTIWTIDKDSILNSYSKDKII